MNHLKSPMILFQGSDDKIVPPEVSREIADILKKKEIKHEYIEYEGEGHGFLKKENIIDSMTKEMKFVKEVLKN